MTWRVVLTVAMVSLICMTVPAAARAAEPPQPNRSASAQTAESYPWRLMNRVSRMCLVVRGNAPETQAVQSTCAEYPDQIWEFQNPVTVDGYEYWMVRNRNSGQCLVARGMSAEAPVVQTSCNPAYADQYWHHESGAEGGNAFAWLVNRNSNLCLVVRNQPDARAVQTPCNFAYIDQLWSRLAA
jgi:hypothetical protein